MPVSISDNRTHGRIKLRNNGRDTITLELEVLEADGSVKKAGGKTPLTQYRELTLGSQDDARLEGDPDVEANGAKIVSPEIEVTGSEFDRLMKQPAFAGAIQSKPPKISHWPVA